jgi:hypothetical protein
MDKLSPMTPQREAAYLAVVKALRELVDKPPCRLHPDSACGCAWHMANDVARKALAEAAEAEKERG